MNRLPTEILQKIFQEASPRQSYNFALVCKSWTIPAQTVLYTFVTIESGSQLRKFSDTITRSPYFGYKVKTLQLKFSPCTLDTVFADLLSDCLPNLEELTQGEPHTYSHILNALLNSKLKYLKRLQPLNNEIAGNTLKDYVDCAFLMKDRLEKICITTNLNSLAQQQDTFGEKRLYKNLHQFKKIEKIEIHEATNDEIAILEYVVEKCKTARCIKFTFHPFHNNHFRVPPPDNNITSATMLKYIPNTTIRSVKCLVTEPNPHKIILYIIHKYPKLDDFDIQFNLIPPLQLDVSDIYRFFEYISRIDTFSVSDFTLKRNILKEGALKLGLKNTKICYTEVSFSSTKFILDICRNGSKQTASTSLRYVGFTTNFIWQMYQNHTVEGGQYIHDLRFKFIQNYSSTPEKYVLPGNFIPHILKHCANLQRLHLKECILGKISGTDKNIDNKLSLDKLSFKKCLINDGFLEKLSEFIHQINLFKLSAVKCSNTTMSERSFESLNSNIDVIMPNTNINTILIEGENLDASIQIKVLSTNNNSHYYYQFKLSEKIYVKCSSDEETYNTSNNDQHIYICCQANPEITFK